MTDTTHRLTFPADFVWGVATASYQIEGAVNEDGRGESIWDRFSHTPGKVTNGDTGDVACDHYHRWRDDIKLMQQLGINAYRFSVAWPRILPAGRGAVNDAGLDFYDRLVDGLLEADITPWVTLYHWDLPQVLQDVGGWPNRATADAFVEYADVLSRRLGDRVQHWITLNEPWCSSLLSYYIGEHAPGHHDLAEGLAAAHTLLLAHGMAVPVLRRNSVDAQVGITLNLNTTHPGADVEADRAAARRFDGFFNRWFLDPLYGRGYPQDMLDLYGSAAPTVEADDFDVITTPTDFLGVNYYSTGFVHDNPDDSLLRIADKRFADGEYTEMDWLVHPQGLQELLGRLAHEYAVPAIYITENGAAFVDQIEMSGGEPRIHDERRINYYAVHLQAASRAIADGVPLRGYFAWSLMDNFEWGHGYTKRFGLYYVDYATQQRILKDSGRWYRDTIHSQQELAV